MSIGANIKRIRKSKRLTQEKLSEITQISMASIQRYESGKRQPNIQTINKIADALGMPVSELLGNSVKTNDIGIKINELYDLIYELRNKISSLEDLNATLIENMEKIKKLVNIKY